MSDLARPWRFLLVGFAKGLLRVLLFPRGGGDHSAPPGR